MDLYLVSDESVLIFVLPYFIALPPPSLGPWTEKGKIGRASTIWLHPFFCKLQHLLFDSTLNLDEIVNYKRPQTRNLESTMREMFLAVSLSPPAHDARAPAQPAAWNAARVEAKGRVTHRRRLRLRSDSDLMARRRRPGLASPTSR